MPGLFDNTGPYQGGGILSGLGNFFAGIGGQMNPAIQESNFRRQAYNALAQQNGPQDAAVLMGNLPAYGLGFQRELFLSQLGELQKRNPKISLNEALYQLSPKGQEQQYGVTPVPGYEFGPYKAPGVITGGQMQAPPGFPGGGAPNASQQPQPSQQPSSPTSSLPPVANSVLEYERQLKANQAKGEEEGAAAGTIQGSVDQIDRSIRLIDEIANNPNAKYATGYMANIPPLKGTQTYGFIKSVDQLKDQLTLDILPSLMRKNSRISPALIEMLQKSTAGQELDRGSPNFAKALQNTRAALLQIRAATQAGANVPVTEPPQAEGPPTFKTQDELRAAIKAKKIKLGDPFRTSDGRTLLAQ